MNKTDICVLSNNPFLYNMYVQNCRHKLLPYIDTLHVLYDWKIGYGIFDDEIRKFYNETFDGINISLSDTQKYDASELILESDEIDKIIQRSKAKSFLYNHLDSFILNPKLLEDHQNYIANDVYDIIFCVFGSGSPEINEIIKEHYPNVYAEHLKTDNEFRNEIHLSFGTMDYTMVKMDVLKKHKFNFGTKRLHAGDVYKDILPNGEDYTFKTNDYYESFMMMMLKMYSLGYQKILPFTSEAHVSLYQINQLDDWDRYQRVGFIHHNGAAYARVFMDCSRDFVNSELNTAHLRNLHPTHSERLFTMQFAPLLFFDFNKYEYMREFFEYYKHHIKQSLNICNTRTQSDVKINVEKIFAYGKGLGLEMFPENMEGI